jgi:hypothetical protein
MAVEINGVAHFQLTVNDPAKCVPFWEKLCRFPSMDTLVRGEDIVYCIGGRTGILVRGCRRGSSLRGRRARGPHRAPARGGISVRPR